MPNTLVHFAAQGGASHALWRRLDPRFVYLGCLLPDLPWILRRAVVGFGVRITAGGSRAFILTYRIKGQERRLTIGAWPDWSVTAAREEAKRLKCEIDQGHDPLAQRCEERESPSVRQLIERYLEEHAAKLAKRNRNDQASMLRKLVEPSWGPRKAVEIQPEDVDKLLGQIAGGGEEH